MITDEEYEKARVTVKYILACKARPDAIIDLLIRDCPMEIPSEDRQTAIGFSSDMMSDLFDLTQLKAESIVTRYNAEQPTDYAEHNTHHGLRP